MSDTSPEVAFAEALAKFQAELPHVKKGQTATVPTKAGGKYTYDYADLTDITEVAVPVLTRHGFAWTASPTVTDTGFVLRYALLHNAGHREGGDYPLPDPSRSSPQEIGSALTYARRYALTAITGIAPGGDDDDGQTANAARSAAPVERTTDFMWLEDIRARLVGCGSPAEVRGLIAEATQVYAQNRLTTEDAKQLRKEMDERTAELKGPDA